MELQINNQIENINRSLDWIRKNRPEQYEQRFLELVDQRRRLRKLKDAERNNPGIAAYGKSQVGKSHIMGCLLQKEVISPDGKKCIKPFEVDAEGVKYNFVEQINPPGEGKEATGVVTRFSSFGKTPQLYDNRYPALMRSLSVTDITIVLCDGYYNDIRDYTTDDGNEINRRAEKLYQRYSNREILSNTPITADNILEMKFYFKRYINNAQSFSRSDFFNKLALVIDRIPVEDYPEVFSYLWHNEKEFTDLYSRLVNVLQKLEFSEYVYLPIDAVAHKNVKDNTVMSVLCLHNLAEPQDPHTCDAFLRQADGTFKKLSNMNMSEISAICGEVMFKVEDEFLNSSLYYNLDSMSDEAKRQLTDKPVKTDIMRNADLLDFPGARSRLEEWVTTVDKKKVVEILLRGKVAYLFNKYSDDRIINILLFCHDNEQNDVRTIDKTIEYWVNQYIGETPDQRRQTIENTGNISPLFYIATKVNIDMAVSANASGNDRTSIDNRWQGRFGIVLYKECLNAGSVEWVHNWTEKGKNFQNSYLLRDFKYSGPNGSKLFEGFAETGKEQRMLMSEEHASLLRESFCNSKDSALFFANRELAWEVAATQNNDGSIYIIENLKKAADRIKATREAQFRSIYRKTISNVLDLIKKYYISDDTAEILAENIRKANGIFRELEFTCQTNPDFFGTLLQALQLNETKCYTEVHKLVPQLSAIVGNDHHIKDYELIRSRCDNFRGCKTEAQKWAKLIDAYRFSSQEEAAEYLQRRGIETLKLFDGGEINRKNSAVIANEIVEIWRKEITDSKFSNTFTGKGKVDGIVLMDLTDCLITASKELNLKQKIEKVISDYVDILNLATINEDLVADAISTTISDFVMDFGYKYLTEEQRSQSFRVAQEQKLNIYRKSVTSRKEWYTEDEMTDLFNKILSSGKRFTPAYEENYNAWLEFMFISHIVHLNVPDFDRVANKALKDIIDAMNKSL